MSFWLKVCIYSHTRGVKLGLGLGFIADQSSSSTLTESIIFFLNLGLIHRGIVMFRIEKGPVQTVAIILEAHNSLEYHYML